MWRGIGNDGEEELENKVKMYSNGEGLFRYGEGKALKVGGKFRT